MTRLGRDIYRRKLERLLAQSQDEPMIGLISAIVGIQGGYEAPLSAVLDMPREAIGAELGSRYHVPLWTMETLVNELLATPKIRNQGIGRTRLLRADLFETVRVLVSILVKLENAEDSIFLQSHDVFYEMGRIAQRQFPWQRGAANAPQLYRSMLLYGSGSAGQFFEESTGIAIADFVKVGAYLAGALGRCELIDRRRDLSSVAISPEMCEAAFARFVIGHAEARARTAQIRAPGRHTAYRPSILRDYPVLAFGGAGQRLRAPIPELITYRYTSGLYLDVVRGGGGVWAGIGSRFETYVCEYLEAMMAPYKVTGEAIYGPKKARFRTPDVLISDTRHVLCAVECKAKRMSFEARFADDPLVEDARGFDEMAKGVLQLWRFFAHARRGLTAPLSLAGDCQGVIVTADSWLTMARNQAEQVLAAANKLADGEWDIGLEDRRDITFCQIDDVEFVLQHGTADSFIAACREVASGEKKGWMLSVAHSANQNFERSYPFNGRIGSLLPWLVPEERERTL
ncbi:hypothetical protein GXW71_05970 [Roseomonas hellenica]|uniref:Uncharacterized protein n=1 Tax=Plastoroseomonas hellenica TaxID=2687306 RepID=A0ABS5EUD2_9PROT|nr:hypothetical protein [Plastoroseomonas hellenica]MBR0663903.1 hypothetical protein [Plastoroseomonas hellenica]